MHKLVDLPYPCARLFVPIPTLVGREELYTQLGFFVKSILADRYIHRREF